MASNEDTLNAGQPPPVVAPGVNVEIPDELKALVRWGNAYLGVAGTDVSPVAWGSYLRRIPVLRNNQTVASSTHTAADPGEITNVVAQDASLTGAKKGKAAGGPDTGEVNITYANNGVATLLFNGSDNVSQCAYNLMIVPQELIDFLDATTDPP